MDKAEFGIYSLGFATMLLLAALISSSIAVQYVVNLPDQPEMERSSYAVNHVNAVAVLSIGLVSIAGFLTLLPGHLLFGSSGLEAVAVVTLCACAAYSLREILVRIAYSAKEELYVLYSSILLLAVVIIEFAVVHQFMDRGMSARRALTVLAIGYAISTVLLVFLLRLPLSVSCWFGLKKAFLDSWRGGKWSLMTSFVHNLRLQAHNFIVAPLLGLAALAEINATRVLVTPALMAIPPVSQIIMPMLAELRAKGISIAGKQTAATVAGLVGLASLYAILLIPFLPWLLPLLLGESYQDTGNLVALWCLVAILMAARNGVTLALEVARRFRGLMVVNVIAAAAAAVLAALLAWSLGAAGAIVAIGVAELILCLLLLKLLFQDQA